jgi:hypothetical protein
MSFRLQVETWEEVLAEDVWPKSTPRTIVHVAPERLPAGSTVEGYFAHV